MSALPSPKVIFTRVAGAATDALAETVNAVAALVGVGTFGIASGELMTWTTVRGDAWDTHDALVALRELSRRLPDLTFLLYFDPDGDDGTLRAGAFEGVRFDEIAAWVVDHPRPIVPVAEVEVRSQPEPVLPDSPELARIAAPERLAPVVKARGRRPLGHVGADAVSVELELQLGRIKSRIVVASPDGAERISRDFINAGALVVAGPRVVMTAERDGVTELVTLEVATFAETAVPTAVRLDDMLAHGDEVIGLTGDREGSTILRGGAPFARVPGWRWHARIGGDAMWFLSHVGDESVVSRVSLVDGGVESVVRWPMHTEQFASAGSWLAWMGRGSSTVHVLCDGTPVRDVDLPAGQTLYQLAISATGALACVIVPERIEDRDRATLDVSRGDDRAAFALPAPFGVRWI